MVCTDRGVLELQKTYLRAFLHDSPSTPSVLVSFTALLTTSRLCISVHRYIKHYHTIKWFITPTVYSTHAQLSHPTFKIQRMKKVTKLSHLKLNILPVHNPHSQFSINFYRSLCLNSTCQNVTSIFLLQAPFSARLYPSPPQLKLHTSNVSTFTLIT
jgi:hypothetical protein